MQVLERMQPTSGNKFDATKLLAALLFSPLFLSALMMTHTSAHPTEISSHAPERERKSEMGRKSQKEECIQYVPVEYRETPVHVSSSACSVYSNTCAHQHSIWLPAGQKCVWCFCTARSVSASRIYLGKQFCFLPTRGGLSKNRF